MWDIFCTLCNFLLVQFKNFFVHLIRFYLSNLFIFNSFIDKGKLEVSTLMFPDITKTVDDTKFFSYIFCSFLKVSTKTQ